MKTIFRFIATTILLAVSYLSFGQSSSQLHKIQDPNRLYSQLSTIIVNGAVSFAYVAVAGDYSFATRLTSSEFEEASQLAVKKYKFLFARIAQMQYVEEVCAEFNKTTESCLQQLFFYMYIEYLQRASNDPRIPLARRNEFKKLSVKQIEPTAYQDWYFIAEQCVTDYLRPLLK